MAETKKKNRRKQREPRTGLVELPSGFVQKPKPPPYVENPVTPIPEGETPVKPPVKPGPVDPVKPPTKPGKEPDQPPLNDWTDTRPPGERDQPPLTDWTDTRPPSERTPQISGPPEVPGKYPQEAPTPQTKPSYPTPGGLPPGVDGLYAGSTQQSMDPIKAPVQGIDGAYKNPSLEPVLPPGPTPTKPPTPTTPVKPPVTPPKTPIISEVPETPGRPGPTPTPTTPGGPDTQIVPGTPKSANEMNVVDYAGQIVADPNKFFTRDDPKTPENESMKLSDHSKQWEMTGKEEGTNINAADPRFGPQDKVNTDVAQGKAFGTEQVDPRDATGYEAQTTQENIAENGQMTAAQGTLSKGSQITAPQIDMQGSGTGVNKDGTVNQTGKALNDYAKQNISTIIDTSTPAGKALAAKLGDGNYTDSKATLQGQLETLQGQFVGPNGEPKIPAWAAGTARNVSKIAAFKGMTGTAATAALSQAIMEASIPIAQQDAAFFQTLTIKNLDNKQESIINKANVLSKLDLANLDARTTAAVENSKAFLQMDLANLENKQQAQVINQQARVQSILEDAKAVNTQRMFDADSQNDMDKFYENLNTSIGQFNASQTNEMTKLNVTEANKMSQFDTEVNTQREQFYKNMQYNIDVANAKWRQSVTMENSQKDFEAASTDVKNMVGIASEQLNQIWDRSDSLLDYLWQSAEKDADRKSLVIIEKLKAEIALDAEDKKGFGSLIGTLIGSIGPKITDWLF